MIIDASLTQSHGCCPTVCPPPCPHYPQPCPHCPHGEAVNAALTNELTAPIASLANGAVLPIESSTRLVGTDLSYDAANHAFVVNTSGTYHIAWNVLTHSTGDTAADVLLVLRSLDGATVLGHAGAVDVPTTGSTTISGNVAVALPAGTKWVLANASGAAIAIPAAGTAPQVFAGQLVVARIG